MCRPPSQSPPSPPTARHPKGPIPSVLACDDTCVWLCLCRVICAPRCLSPSSLLLPSLLCCPPPMSPMSPPSLPLSACTLQLSFILIPVPQAPSLSSLLATSPFLIPCGHRCAALCALVTYAHTVISSMRPLASISSSAPALTHRSRCMYAWSTGLGVFVHVGSQAQTDAYASRCAQKGVHLQTHHHHVLSNQSYALTRTRARTHTHTGCPPPPICSAAGQASLADATAAAAARAVSPCSLCKQRRRRRRSMFHNYRDCCPKHGFGRGLGRG
jgi:hypothetical protein